MRCRTVFRSACRAAVVIAAATMGGGAPMAAERFEVAAWVDHFDFAGVRQGEGYMFDTETAEGCARILDHVQEVGATTILWRNCGGANMRYQSQVDSHHHGSMLDKRRLPDLRVPHGWVRYGEAQPDIISNVMGMCRQRGLRGGVHWPFEETHGAGWTVGAFNLEHPQYWGRTVDGQPWWGRCSLAFDEVVEHKLALVDELVERGIVVLFIDFYRSGGWSPAYEYVEPVVASYREKHGTDPPKDARDLQWCRHVASYLTAFLHGLRQRLGASGREIDLMVGIPEIAPLGDQTLASRAADWQAWLDEGIIDGLVINYVKWDPERPMASTRELCREVMAVVNGRCRVLWPVRAYDYSGYGMPSYQKATGLSQDGVAAQLMEMAWEEGASGVSLECVDYNNYRPETRQRMRELAEGKCKWARSDLEP
jgi:hypothetical protein